MGDINLLAVDVKMFSVRLEFRHIHRLIPLKPARKQQLFPRFYRKFDKGVGRFVIPHEALVIMPVSYRILDR